MICGAHSSHKTPGQAVLDAGSFCAGDQQLARCPDPGFFFPWHPPFSTSINYCCALSRYDRIKSNLCCDRAELNVTRSSSDSIYKPRTPLPMCPAAIHMQPEKRFPSFTRHNKYHSEWLLDPWGNPLYDKKWKPRLCKLGVFWAQDGTTCGFLENFVQGSSESKAACGLLWAEPAGQCSLGNICWRWTEGTECALTFPLPMLLHPVPSIQQGGQLLWPMSKGIPASGGFLWALSIQDWGHLPCTQWGGSVTTQMFGLLLKISRPPKYLT